MDCSTSTWRPSKWTTRAIKTALSNAPTGRWPRSSARPNWSTRGTGLVAQLPGLRRGHLRQPDERHPGCPQAGPPLRRLVRLPDGPAGGGLAADAWSARPAASRRSPACPHRLGHALADHPWGALAPACPARSRSPRRPWPRAPLCTSTPSSRPYRWAAPSPACRPSPPAPTARPSTPSTRRRPPGRRQRRHAHPAADLPVQRPGRRRRYHQGPGRGRRGRRQPYGPDVYVVGSSSVTVFSRCERRPDLPAHG